MRSERLIVTVDCTRWIRGERPRTLRDALGRMDILGWIATAAQVPEAYLELGNTLCGLPFSRTGCSRLPRPLRPEEVQIDDRWWINCESELAVELAWANDRPDWSDAERIFQLEALLSDTGIEVVFLKRFEDIRRRSLGGREAGKVLELVHDGRNTRKPRPDARRGRVAPATAD